MIPGIVIEAPAVRWFSARTAELDERGLHHWVRAWSKELQAPHVSRSYSYPYAVVAWHTEPVGVDIGRVTAFEAERTSVRCSKEALANALGDALEYDARRLEPPTMWADGEAGPWRTIKLDAPLGHVAWVCWRAAVPGGVLLGSREPAVGGGAQLGSRGPCSRRATSSSSRSSSRPRVTASSSAAQ